MTDISFVQYKMLKRINKNQNIKYKKLSDEEIKICEFLAENNFVILNTKSMPVPNNPYHAHIPVRDNYEITEEGRAQIYSFKSTFYKTRTSIILSVFSTIAAICSTIVAIIALLKT